MSNLTLHGLLGGLHVFVQIFPSFFYTHHSFFLGSTSHDQKIVVLDFSAGLDVKLFV